MAGFIDAWGRGILDILKMMNSEGLENPEFEESGGSFRILFNRQTTPQAAADVGKNVGKEYRQKMIFGMIESNIKFTYVSLAEKFSVSEKTVERDIQELKEKKEIRFVGNKRKGYWEIY